MRYRIDYDGTYWNVQKEIKIGYSIFSTKVWITIKSCWFKNDAYDLFNLLKL